MDRNNHQNSHEDHYDWLPVYHHTSASFNAKLHQLVVILSQAKESNLFERFIRIQEVLNDTFSHELLYHLHESRLMNCPHCSIKHLNFEGDHHAPQYLLHLWCLLGCTDSVEYIAQNLEITNKEVMELIAELHHSFSIEPLIVQIRNLYQKNKEIKEYPQVCKLKERLGVEPVGQPSDTAEYRRQRIRARDYLAKLLNFKPVH